MKKIILLLLDIRPAYSSLLHFFLPVLLTKQKLITALKNILILQKLMDAFLYSIMLPGQ